ncbi:hypothetical protein CASFOL_030104 [Castilleja foliolosa]|uniref:Uncharacterized protein n=1 Tax=Castilleja foliolosa TaxID=1961234 RepID=A0ABD3C9P7_9LAMI
METAVISDAISSISHSAQSLAFSNLLNRPNNVLSLSDTSSDQPPRSPTPFHISAASPPPTRTLTKRRTRKIQRVRRRIVIDHDGEEDGKFVFSDGGGFNSGDGYFGSGGGGSGWNFGGYGGANWEGFPDNSIPDPAFDFVYEVLCWIAMSNCLHFAFKKVARFVGDRGKVPLRLTPVC